MIQRVPLPVDSRTAPIVALRHAMPVPLLDSEARDERVLLHRIDLKEQVQR